MSQFALPFEWPAGDDENAFIRSAANAAVVRHLDHWSLWPVPVTLLTGPRKSGRSLLGRIFAAKTGGALIDDAERRPEEELFHAWNRAQETRRPLLAIADQPPPVWQIALPDLRSRMMATPHVAIEEPDDALFVALIERMLGARGLPAPPDLSAFLLARIERSYVGIQRAVEAIDSESLSDRTRIGVRMARRALAKAGVIDVS
ncbi:P-loop NTPase family protein [Flavisphingomonas formosensis]|uniref:DnaA ATPase domain-containing protein n=1 Tax=Flavisphingomonas formosensis TaxID=861534 RepID=UPI0012F97047|nr:DnaA/Hda family protein [Sphingomonas formosensis]